MTMKISPIGWTDCSGGDLNFVIRGAHDCPISPGCANCYVATWNRRWGNNKLPEYTTFYPEKLRRLRSKRFPEFSPKRGAPHKPMVFVCDFGDLFHAAVPDSFIVEAFNMMLSRDDVVWQILTKRPEKMHKIFSGIEVPEHIWLGVTAEDKKRADERIPILLDIPAAMRWVSVEPMLERIDIYRYLGVDPDREMSEMGISWVVCGAESGPNRRPFDDYWAKDLYEQCAEADVPYFGKQDSGLYPGEPLVLPGYGIVREWPGGEKQ